MIKEKEVKELVRELMQRTTFYGREVPYASSFFTAHEDLAALRRGHKSISVRHASCGSEIVFEVNEKDPSKSCFACERYEFKHGNYNSCQTWTPEALKKMNKEQLRQHFYTALLEGEAGEWPDKLVVETAGRSCYTTTRPCTEEELLEGRVRRLLEIRGA